MTTPRLLSLSKILAERRDVPPLGAVLTGEIPIVAKVRFADGGIELRASPASRTDLISVRPGDLLVSGINALKGAIALYPKSAAQDVAATIHYSAYKIDETQALPDYLHEYLRSEAFRRRALSQLPNGIKTELKARRLLAIEVPLPDLDGQHMKLRELTCRRELVRSLAGRRRRPGGMVLGRRVSVGIEARRLLAAALRGMQDDIQAHNPMGSLEQALVERLRHGPSFPCAQDSDGVPVLMPSSTTGFGLDTTKVLFAVGSPTLSDLDYLEPGDILFARGNKPDQVGNCGLYEGESASITYANLFMRIRVDARRYEPRFAQYWLMTPGVHEHVRRHTKGTGPSIQKINGRGVRSIPFPQSVSLPSQQWWVGQLDAVRLLTSRLEELETNQLSQILALDSQLGRETFSDL